MGQMEEGRAEHKPLSEDVGHLWNGEGQWDSGESPAPASREA